MPELIGQIVNIKLGSFLPGTVNSFDIASVTLKEAGTNVTWLLHVWNSRDAEPAFRRVQQTQRLALLREAAFRKLTVHVFHQNDSTLIDQFSVDTA